MDHFIGVLKKYTVFDGRASRAEYWFFVLFSLLITIGLSIVSFLIGDEKNVIGLLFSLAVLIPSIAVAIRRLHDTNKSGWWLLISFVPFVGGIVLLVLLLLGGDSGANNYGPKPNA